jgi:hypothetical protein
MNAKQGRIEALFDAALTFQPDQRQAFLLAACGGDSDLRQQLEVLLQAKAEAGGFLPEQPLDTITVVIPITEKTGDPIGRYKLLQQIGGGGGRHRLHGGTEGTGPPLDAPEPNARSSQREEAQISFVRRGGLRGESRRPGTATTWRPHPGCWQRFCP